MSFLDQFRQPPPTPNSHPSGGGSFWGDFAGAGQGYALAALQREADEVRHAPEGQRNHTLNRAAFSAGQLVAGGALDQERAVSVLLDAARAAGLSRVESERTIASGFRGGAVSPRTVPERPIEAGNHATNHATNHEAVTQPTDPADDPEWTGRISPGGSFVLDAPPMPPAVWGAGEAVAWAQGEALMLCGPAGVGKTTVAVQIIAGRLGLGDGELFGLPIRPGRRVLYLAMDRPPQISRAMARLFTEFDRRALDEKLVVWKGPPPRDMAKNPEILAKMCDLAKADTVVIDSLKDAATKLSDDETGGGYNRARQRALVEGVEVLELHHQRKAGGDNKRPSKLDDVYGSTWLTAGAGSVLLLWGEAGDPVVELIHLKQPAEPLGPWMVAHDHDRGRSRVQHQPDVLTLVRNQRQFGMTVRLLATTLYMTDKPSRNDIERARRKLQRLERDGLVKAVAGHKGGKADEGESMYYAVESAP